MQCHIHAQCLTHCAHIPSKKGKPEVREESAVCPDIERPVSNNAGERKIGRKKQALMEYL